jgi:5-methylcytosine-specific restriction protein A
MNAIILLWKSSEKDSWITFDYDLKRCRTEGSFITDWNVHTKNIQVGDYAFFYHTGKNNGIFGAGFVTDPPYKNIDWKGKDKQLYYIDIKVCELVDPNSDELLSRENLPKELINSNLLWSSGASTITNDSLINEIIDKWSQVYNTKKNFDKIIDEIFKGREGDFREGRVKERISKIHERNYKARIQCIRHHSYTCKVCKLNFYDKYGEAGKDFIHVHHKILVSSRDEAYSINPIEDLVPVCPNCHAIIHKRNPPYEVDEVKQMLH